MITIFHYTTREFEDTAIWLELFSKVRIIFKSLNVSQICKFSLSGIASHVTMPHESDITSWLHANFESGIETDVVPREHLWQSYLETLSTAESRNAITRDEFFTSLGIVLQDDDFKAVKTMRNRGKKIGYRFLRSKKVVSKKEEEVGNVKASKVINVESRPIPQETGANQHTNDMGEDSSRVRQEDPPVLERQPHQKTKTSPLNFEAEKEKDEGSMKEISILQIEIDPPPQDLGRDAENLDYVFDSDEFHKKGSGAVRPVEKAEKVDDEGSMKESKILKLEIDPPPQNLGRDADNLDYVSDSDEFHKKGSGAVRPVGFCEKMNWDVSEIETGGPSREQMVEEQLGCSDASNIEDREFGDSFDDALSTFSTSEDGLSDASKERNYDLEERSPGTKRRTLLADKPENERKNVRLFSQRVTSRSRRHRESQKHLRKSEGLKFRVQDEKLVGHKKQRQNPQNLSRLSDSTTSEEELEVLRQPANAIPVESSSFYKRHYKNINSLLPKHLPGGPKSFRDYLSRLFVTPDVTNLKRIEIHQHCGESSNLLDARCRAFLATSFPPIKVGRLAGKEVEHTFSGDLFPQFSQQKKSQ